jgi:glutamyl-tRNA synthetase
MLILTNFPDPRFPTIRGIRRRGMTILALREFILKQGPSKNVALFDWGLIWATVHRPGCSSPYSY